MKQAAKKSVVVKTLVLRLRSISVQQIHNISTCPRR
jgi:hypothetical protein